MRTYVYITYVLIIADLIVVAGDEDEEVFPDGEFLVEGLIPGKQYLGVYL